MKDIILKIFVFLNKKTEQKEIIKASDERSAWNILKQMYSTKLNWELQGSQG